MILDNIWLIATAGGAFVLGAAIAYGIMRNRKLSGGERAAQDRKVRDLYAKDNPAKSR